MCHNYALTHNIITSWEPLDRNVKKFLYSDSLKMLATSQWNILWQFSFLTCRLETVCVFLKQD